MPKVTRLCDVDGCGRKHQAKGLCGSHWNQQYGKRKQVEVACPTCGETTMKRDDGPNSTRRFCSLTCRDLWRIDQPDDPMHRIADRPRQKTVSRLPNDHPVMWVNAVEPLIYGECAECGTPTCSLARNPKRYCGAACRRRVRNRRIAAKRKARHAGGRGGGAISPTMGMVRAPISRALRIAVYERDAWTCWLCGYPTSSTYTTGDPLSPTLDHVLPHSHGGTDDEDNLATAHAGCNSARGNTDTLTWAEPVLWTA